MERNKRVILKLQQNFPSNRISAMIQLILFFHIGYLCIYAIPFSWKQFLFSIVVLILCSLFFFVIGLVFGPSKDGKMFEKKESIEEKVNKYSQYICLTYAIIGSFFAIILNHKQGALYAVCLSVLISIYSVLGKNIINLFFPSFILAAYWVYVCLIIKDFVVLSSVVNGISYIACMVISIGTIHNNSKKKD